MNVMRRVQYFLLMIFIGFLSSCATETILPSESFSTKEININGHLITVKIADTEKKRKLGLMFRKKMPDDQGMLFQFPHADKWCFWMKNTRIPLSLVFLTNKGNISQIESMKPFDENLICAKQNIVFAIEMNQGWFKQNQVNLGAFVSGVME